VTVISIKNEEAADEEMDQTTEPVEEVAGGGDIRMTQQPADITITATTSAMMETVGAIVLVKIIAMTIVKVVCEKLVVALWCRLHLIA
jgi:hypothetical protein